MAELNIRSLFSTLCGGDILPDEKDVRKWRLDERIAKALGIIDANGNCTEKSYTLEQTKNIKIDDLLEIAHQQSNIVKAGQSNDDKSKILEAFRKLKNENQSEQTNNTQNTNRPTRRTKYKRPKTYLRIDQTNEQKLFDDANDLLTDFANGKKRPKITHGKDGNGNKFKRAEYKGQWIEVFYDKNNQIKEIRISHIKNNGPNGDIAEISYQQDKAYYTSKCAGYYEGSIEAWQFEWKKLIKIAEAIFK